MAKFDFDADLVRKLAELLEETGLTEIEYAIGEKRVRVARAGSSSHAQPGGIERGAGRAGDAAAEPAGPHPGAVTAPMVGTVYLSPEPGASPFVRVGDNISEGQTLLLIEAMKTYNPIRAPRAGKIVRILVADGAPVEYGSELLIVE